MNLTETLWSHIRTVSDFPRSGICFYDLTPLFLDQIEALTDALIQSMPEEKLAQVDSFMAVEARGFVLASFLAQRLNKGLILVRKAGKLPPPVVGMEYSLEYGTDKLELSANIQPQKVILVDDVLATGGTLRATQQLAEKSKLDVLGTSVLLDLELLNAPLDMNVWSVLQESTKP
ncbi:adenine phosphoribosyltransferase [Acinetobacter nectaris]|uniref:adenine phosphoribosyltransferase n=1 Tax=Acinetobacter nectaris TaxID=1219382 RepID=UPI001F027D15|nr:adenine phosphoribosyltransferase [Acinetobacter nectaris]MCF8998968.1 adenine phosphoribosyltransferase [Acinetobacter nectaris]MCF9027439.1 adenine phosphoribosyltransferase [Acinetobacter nectaris]